ncbi:hypothetical protein JA33_317 [Dickeya phage vB_DsoM_JA33]|uniref:Uncharacterized protein n=3 Tax=Salmondvirus JA11 TaxID=2734141 RepID=A0A384ZWV2_9CAUD|nr:hypothetical protein HOU32_gp317 [Dickeya phage vB_DsoM_JA11]AXG66722.1 hypothetical protein JA13_319 [Dickeya phage vB_DsoM_JA13]AXG67691.1 hypothetical protein JA33_317 [Dickeya phage vB_DsoM_JA33]AYD80122.1 hypothetical protein JA11_317 [Dickeya phage vB_DsoM_JA11]
MNSPVVALRNRIDDVVEALTLIKNGSLLKRSDVVGALHEADVESAKVVKEVRSSVYKSYPDVLECKSGFTAALTTCVSLAGMLKSKSISRPAFLKKISSVLENLRGIRTDVERALTYLPEDENSDVEDRAISRREARERAASSKTSRLLEQMHAKYSHKVPTKLKGAIYLTTLPLMARFGTFSMNPDNLSKLGFKVHNAGLHSAPSSDLGIVLEEQLVMFFRMSDALENSEEASKKFKTGGVNKERTDLQKRRNAERRELRLLNQNLEGVTNINLKKAINKRIEKTQKAIDELTAKIDNLNESVKQHNSTARVVRQMNNTTEISILNYAAPILDSLNAKASSDYGLFTTKPLSGLMADSDVFALWLMPKPTIKMLLKLTNGDTKLDTWFLPWSNGR